MICNYSQFIKESTSDDNYIFLDIDGVVIPYDRDSKFDYHKFFNMKEKWSKEAISVLNQICKEYNCKVVLITSYISSKPFIEIKDKLKELGFNGKVVDELKYHYGKENRFENISYYVKEKGISNYVVIDDQRHDIDKDPEIRKHWCNTHSKDGLKKENLSKIKSILNKKTH